ncbi:unnamed protein product [Schistosoma curassoni]|uniref:Uncharacterized protein n=1 Tax=Schistosoma curassoni TaxID=6186 RepID=A0A183JUC3_9TREM|nr:unnamed protein product [Schistosoma curassoni]
MKQINNLMKSPPLAYLNNHLVLIHLHLIIILQQEIGWM